MQELSFEIVNENDTMWFLFLLSFVLLTTWLHRVHRINSDLHLSALVSAYQSNANNPTTATLSTQMLAHSTVRAIKKLNAKSINYNTQTLNSPAFIKRFRVPIIQMLRQPNDKMRRTQNLINIYRNKSSSMSLLAGWHQSFLLLSNAKIELIC